MNDIAYMKRMMELAQRAKGKTSPNPIVGALLVKGGRVIAEGWHHHCGADHAEIVALKKAGKRARGAKLYVTLEPCSHYGRTPPCVDAIIRSGIKEVVVGMKDPNPVNNGKSLVKLKKAGIKIKVGFLESELKKMNEIFVKYIQTKIPFVVVKIAQTLDGKIATATGQSKWITSARAREYSHRLRNDFDAILVGINTVLKDNPGLNAEQQFKRFKKIILDSSLRISLRAKLFKNTQASDIIMATTQDAPKSKREFLLKKGVHVIVCPSKGGRINIKWLLSELGRQDITSVLVEGGAQVVGSFLKEKCVDKFLIFIAPKLMGDQNALSAIQGISLLNVEHSQKLKNISVKHLGQDILIEAYPE